MLLWVGQKDISGTLLGGTVGVESSITSQSSWGRERVGEEEDGELVGGS